MTATLERGFAKIFARDAVLGEKRYWDRDDSSSGYGREPEYGIRTPPPPPSSPFSFFPVSDFSLQITLNISQTPSASGSMSLHKVTAPNNDSTIRAEILPSDGRSELTIYFRFNEPPSLTEYDLKTTLPHQDHAVGNYTLFVSRDLMQGSGDYYVGILPTAHENEPRDTAVNYTFDVISSACYFWDESSKEWSSKGCKVNCC